MSRRLVLRLLVLVAFALTTIDSWIYVFRSICYNDDDDQRRSHQLPGMTDADLHDPVVSALRDALPSSLDDPFDCRKLFGRDTHAHAFSMSADFRRNVDEFLEAVKASLVRPGTMEGNSFQMETEYRLLHYLTARLQFVRTVCETGFNAGHSSFNFLTARRDINVHSFDLGRHQYVEPMVSYLQRKFPGRLNVQMGDSRQTVPSYFSGARVNLTADGCDIALVDGGHGFNVALSDIRNLARVTSVGHNLVIVDDVNNRQVRSAWKVALRSDNIQQLFTCRYGRNGRAFAVGVVSQDKRYSSIFSSSSSNRGRRKSRTAMYWTGLYCSLYVCLSIVVIAAVVLMVLYLT